MASGGSPRAHHQVSPSSSSNNNNNNATVSSKAIAQYAVDARLHAVYEQSGESGKSFDYSQSIKTTTDSVVAEQQMSAYLSKIQRGGHIQPFGCMIAINNSTFRVIAFSENARDRLGGGGGPQSVPFDSDSFLTIGTDVMTLFTPSSADQLLRAFRAREITLLNPVWVHSKISGKPFYAILHRIDVGIVIDLEPARTEDPALSIAGAVQSQKLAVRAISNLQSLPSGDIKLLCDAVVHNVRDLTGYDRVMVYKFHEDEHGWAREDVIGKMLVGEIFGSCCRLKGPDSLTKFMIILHNAIGGQDTDKHMFSFFDRRGKYVQALLTANKRVNLSGGEVMGAFCFLQIASPELQQAMKIQRQQENKCFERMKELAYICHEIKNPLSGIRFSNALLETTNLTDEQKQLLETSAACQKQMLKIVKDVDMDNIQEGHLELEKQDFVLVSVIDAVVSQVMFALRDGGVQLIRDIPEEVKTLTVHGDQTRVQQVLTNFLLNMIQHSASPNGWVEIQVRPTLKQSIIDGMSDVHIDFKIVCPGSGLPAEVVQDMFHSSGSEWRSEEGLGLSMCRKIVKLMNGDVQYIRESERCYFHVMLQLSLPHTT
ncbi:hypothetical protein M8C21_015318 [Ambrosia artemisiifolia]|uniref:Phytochrome n=1 Tax=Ambrosia artemisiifolia TaxID=4212 RepID=A0AAD5C9T8_AMBAR|nr:hypothetical protein M8C21_015318 [Ambrosia artemisiifolia]